MSLEVCPKCTGKLTAHTGGSYSCSSCNSQFDSKGEEIYVGVNTSEPLYGPTSMDYDIIENYNKDGILTSKKYMRKSNFNPLHFCPNCGIRLPI